MAHPRPHRTRPFIVPTLPLEGVLRVNGLTDRGLYRELISKRRRPVEVLGGLRVKRRGRGRARTRPKVVYANAAYDAKAIREGLRRRGIRAGIPKNPRRGKGTRGGKRAFRRRKADRRARSRVERFFGWQKGGFRRWTVRHERRLATFLAFVLLACFLSAWRILR
jgi:hypothetical protein